MKPLSVDQPKLIFGMALFFGTIIRFAPVIIADFPLNDGGMFLSMIRDLRVSGYFLPQVTSYNLTDIPYAYPPFGFYLARLLADLGFNDLFLLRFLPALISSIAIYGMFLFVSALKSRELAAWATLIFALTPRSYAWLIMGGGLTRSLGFCFILFTGWAVYHLFCRGSLKWLALSILFSAITVLSHPQAAIHTLSLCILLWLFFGRTRQSAFHAVLVAIGTLLLTMPWWGVVLAYHGPAPFVSIINIGRGSGHGISLPVRFWTGIFPTDSLIPIVSIFFVLGILWGIVKRQWFLLIWIVLPFIVDPRSGVYIILFPLSVLAAMLLSEIATYLIRNIATVNLERSQKVNLLFLILPVYLFIDSYLYGYRLVNTRLMLADRSAIEWVQKNTPLESRFVLYTGNIALEYDPFQEWFPALAERNSLTAFQGTEWTLGSQFFSNFRELVNLQTCTSADCLQVWVTKNNVAFDYLLVRKKDVSWKMTESLKSDDHFRMIFEDDAIVMFSTQ